MPQAEGAQALLERFARKRDLAGLAPVLARAGALEARLAATGREVRRAQGLRYRMFFEAGGATPNPAARLTRRDLCRFDSVCDHLVVVDRTAPAPDGSPSVVGVYRLLRQDVAARNFGFYSAREFEVEQLIARRPDARLLEVGRACIADTRRGRRVLELLWRGLWAYARHHADRRNDRLREPAWRGPSSARRRRSPGSRRAAAIRPGGLRRARPANSRSTMTARGAASIRVRSFASCRRSSRAIGGSAQRSARSPPWMRASGRLTSLSRCRSVTSRRGTSSILASRRLPSRSPPELRCEGIPFRAEFGYGSRAAGWPMNDAPVAQLDRALPSEGKGQRFESPRARHKINGLGRRSLRARIA